MKALFRLEAQRTKAVKDLEQLEEVRDKAMNDPLGFVTSLQNGENLNLPASQDIVQIPHIDWEKYNVKSIMQTMRPKTRKRILQESLQSHNSSPEVKDPCSNGDGKYFVRGRAYDESKPQTFNQAWSEDEQRKLEELLIKFPDEPIASHRWMKISKELGTRTSLQVQSRVQKYFIALKREKLPVPGRAPRNNLVRRQGFRRKGFLHSNSSSRTSIFMKAFEMEDEESLAATSHLLADIQTSNPEPWDVSDEEDISEELRESEEYQELLRLKQVRKLKLQEEERSIITHYGFACDVCGINPIEGVRWHCIECPSSTSTDVCDKCVKTSFTNEWHQTTHILQPVRALSIRDTVVL
ncbi:unnamed protein product, partial [Meganyctiphanes norvegica]